MVEITNEEEWRENDGRDVEEIIETKNQKLLQVIFTFKNLFSLIHLCSFPPSHHTSSSSFLLYIFVVSKTQKVETTQIIIKQVLKVIFKI